MISRTDAANAANRRAMRRVRRYLREARARLRMAEDERVHVIRLLVDAREAYSELRREAEACGVPYCSQLR